MTHHYTIEIITKKLFFKTTYRNGKFRKLEHLRGKLDREIMDALGKVIPVAESEISSFNKKWINKVNYQIEVRAPESLYTRFLNTWISFFEKHNNGLTPKFTGADGNALKSIITYLKKQSVTDDETIATWQLILDKWDELSAFHQKQMDLKYINSKLNVINREIIQNNGSSVAGTNGSVSL